MNQFKLLSEQADAYGKLLLEAIDFHIKDYCRDACQEGEWTIYMDFHNNTFKLEMYHNKLPNCKSVNIKNPTIAQIYQQLNLILFDASSEIENS